jgi:3-methyladenine DNA glycosylase AlkD
MTAQQIVERLQSLGNDSYKNVLRKHGVQEPVFGVKIEELKKIQKQIKKDYRLSLELYDTGIYDAMYLAGLIADDERMTVKDIRRWLKKANCPTLGEYTVPWVAVENKHGRELALEWIDSRKEIVAACGWATLGGLVAVKEDADLDMAELTSLLQRVKKTIHEQPDGARHAMNNFVIAVGCYVKSLTDTAVRIATEIGPIKIDMGDTACKVPYAPDYIQKVRDRGAIGKKRKTIRC